MTRVLAIIGTAANQVALVAKLNAIHPIDHIVLVEKSESSVKSRKTLTDMVVAATINMPFRTAWQTMLRTYSRDYSLPSVPTNRVSSVNQTAVRALIASLKPELVIVSGTDLLRNDIINEISRYGKIMNLHTGLSPYIRGGPNCTNWALYLNRFDMIGNTIMWLDPGIDTGHIIASEKTDIKTKDSLGTVHVKVMEHAHDLYGRCFKAFLDGHDLPSLPQDTLDRGRLFLTKHWTASARLRALRNFYFSRRNLAADNMKTVRTVDLDTESQSQ